MAVWDFFFVFMLSLSLCWLEFSRHIALLRKLSRPCAHRKTKKAKLRDRSEAGGTTASSTSSGRCTHETGLSGGGHKTKADQVP